MKEKLDLTVISEKFHDAEPQNVHAYEELQEQYNYAI